MHDRTQSSFYIGAITKGANQTHNGALYFSADFPYYCNFEGDYTLEVWTLDNPDVEVEPHASKKFCFGRKDDNTYITNLTLKNYYFDYYYKNYNALVFENDLYKAFYNTTLGSENPNILLNKTYKQFQYNPPSSLLDYNNEPSLRYVLHLWCQDYLYSQTNTKYDRVVSIDGIIYSTISSGAMWYTNMYDKYNRTINVAFVFSKKIDDFSYPSGFDKTIIKQGIWAHEMAHQIGMLGHTHYPSNTSNCILLHDWPSNSLTNMNLFKFCQSHRNILNSNLTN